MSSSLRIEFDRLASTPSDINEHLPTLRRYAAECGSVAELGVRGVVSTFACLLGLAESSSAGGPPKKWLEGMDLDPVDHTARWQLLERLAATEGVETNFVRGDSASTPLTRPVDLLFIDTFHVYGHLRRELAFHKNSINKYIILHDTAVDGTHGEALRLGMDVLAMSWTTEYSHRDLTTGLQPAIDEFLEACPEWRVLEIYDNNNGLTVLGKV